ncbi:uncharacterized protein LOC129567266 [Sitodiplosis mosellana]|uniref:uncharacterized protein LOC129567266 n=1 Tax=Sitodiplosis mosellana TaxID=263140 RepID=UPI0024447B2E|nr:uncharacterized protein LOC129567266 [Sitodiplosis mosellana]
MNSKMLEHLSGRPIAPIVETWTENSSMISLKIVCILDYKLEKSGLYEKMTPKLMMQLLNIHPSFDLFKYFKYYLEKEVNIAGRVLKCKCCEMIGPYLMMLEHMAINHNMHASAVLCMWCEKINLQAHNTSNSLDMCYENYLKKNKFSTTTFPNVIVQFYDLLKELAKILGVLTKRYKQFKNTLVNKNETISFDQNDDSMSSKIIVSNPKRRKYRDIDLRSMEKLYREAMTYFCKQQEYIDTTLDANATNANQLVSNGASDLGSSSGSSSGSIQNSDDHTRIGKNSKTFAMPGSSTRCDSPPLLSPFDVPSSSSQFALPPPLPDLQPMPLFGVSTQESDFDNFVSFSLRNMQDESLKKRAKMKIQHIIHKYSAKDLSKQMEKARDSDDSSSDD